ncbi:hypothetical protein B0H13DRAFT_2004755 [Mycena leptocephala]|nr:hypothetical protein B0H13DRAFT_2004755 [Mycena leptocephala]
MSQLRRYRLGNDSAGPSSSVLAFMAASSILRAATIQSLLKPRAHPMDSSRVRMTASLGDQLGLTKLGIHKSALAPHAVSSVEHFHDIDDEWFYVLKGSGTLLCAGEGEDTAVAAGDFVGNGYLCGGSRAPVDVSHYPLKHLMVDEENEKTRDF